MKTKLANTRLPVYDLNGKTVDNIQLDEKLFNGCVNKQLLYEAKKMYEANQRQGTGSAKTRAEVAGGGTKPWRQKGTGRARVGSIRNPLWRHGGVTFAPKPRDFRYSMPKKALNKALLSGLNIRLTENMVKSIVKIELEKAKTKQFKAILDALEIKGSALIVVNEMSENVKRSSRNLKNIRLKEGRNINVMDVLLNAHLLIEKEAFQKLAERLK